MAYLLTNYGRNSLIIGLFVAFLGGCSKTDAVSDNVKDYYTSVLDWGGGGMVYIYEPVSDNSLPQDIWHYRFVGDWRGNFIYSSRYNIDGEIVQRVVERLERNGSRLRSMDLLYWDDGEYKAVDVQINEPVMFPFGSRDSTLSSTMQVEYMDTTSDSVRVILTKVRNVVSTTEYKHYGEFRPAIVVDVHETLETETEGYTTTEWSGTEIYVQDVGLVYFKKPVNETLVLEYVLADAMPFTQFQNTLQTKIDLGNE